MVQQWNLESNQKAACEEVGKCGPPPSNKDEAMKTNPICNIAGLPE